MKKILKALIVILPWLLKRRLLIFFYDYKLNPSSHIGYSWIFPDKLILEENASIGHFNVAIHLHNMVLKKGAKIGRGNWITGFSLKTNSQHFTHQKDRIPELILSEESAITKNHHIDCTHQIFIGKFTTIGGYQSQLLTHAINIEKGIQDSKPIYIGNYCFIGTNVVILGGAVLPSYSVLGAKSLLNKKFEEEYNVYGGVPAIAVQSLSKEAAYFTRESGFVY
jgi:acetyltransferase-like isoleucine patch superfamily enzyme